MSLLDAGLAAGLVVLTIIAQPHLLASDTLVGVDTATQYYPWYSFLGQSLIAGRIPGWNPATFSGAPFAADPLSGWTYLPAMVFFAALPLAQAARAYTLFHPLLAALSAYALARALGLTRAGAFVAGEAYASSGFLQIQNLCCSPVASIYAWLPLTLLGVEKAWTTAKTTKARAWWGLAALGVSQLVAVWPGQGAYYAALIVGGYIAYRALVLPPVQKAAPRQRIARLVRNEAWVFIFGAALAAAGVLPRIEFNALSNLPGGYGGENLGVGGLQLSQWVYLASPGAWYVGLSVLLLAVAAPFVARRRVSNTLWYFGITSIGALLLTGTAETPLHWLMYRLLPGFASLHPHAPERILTVAYLGPALLAGTSVSVLWHRQLLRRTGVFLGLVLLIGVDLTLSGARARSDRLLTDPLDGIERLTPVDLTTFYEPTAASTFLEQRWRQSPVRFAGYAPDIDGRPLPYTYRFVDPGTTALLVNNRALSLGLQDAQGYDASHLRRYDAYMAALNRQTQNYHDATIFPTGLSSPLLDMLNVRYLLVDADAAAGLERFTATGFQDRQVRIVENATAFPRAWIVHAAEQVAPGGVAGISAIASGQVDATHTALLEEPPPPLDVPADPSLDRAIVLTYEANALAVRTSTSAAGLLVLSEIYYPAWRAYVDGQSAPLYVANGALRAVAVAAGEHTVELRFESDALRIGVLVSGSATVLLIILAVVSCRTSPTN